MGRTTAKPAKSLQDKSSVDLMLEGVAGTGGKARGSPAVPRRCTE